MIRLRLIERVLGRLGFVLFAGFALSLVVLASQPPSPSSGRVERQPQPQQTTPAQTDPTPTPLRGTQTDPFVVRESRTEEQAAEDRADRADNQANRRYSIVLSIITTIVIGFQVWLLIRQNSIMEEQTTLMTGQLTATKQAADAAKSSADAIKIINRQWLAIEDWEVTHSSLGNTGILRVVVWAWIHNKTNLPVFVRTMRGTINGKRAGHEWLNSDLTPQNRLQVSIDRLYQGEERVKFESSRPTLAVEGWVHFYDVFGDEQSQRFGAYIDYTFGGPKPVIRGLAGLNKSLAQLADEWPLDEPTQYTRYQPQTEKKP